MSRAFLIFLAGIPMTVIGLFAVAFALPFSWEYGPSIPFRQHPELGHWRMRALPAWATQWDNPVDGAYGDQRGWWANESLLMFGKPHNSFISMWWWLSIRNPANYWSRITTGVDASRCFTRNVSYGKYAKHLIATRDDGVEFPLHEGFFPYPGTTHGLFWRFGWKVELETVSPDLPMPERFRGSVFRFHPWKSK